MYKGDHIFGLLPLMASRLNGAGGTSEGVDDPRNQLGGHQEVSLNACFIARFLTLSHSLSKYTDLWEPEHTFEMDWLTPTPY